MLLGKKLLKGGKKQYFGSHVESQLNTLVEIKRINQNNYILLQNVMQQLKLIKK